MERPESRRTFSLLIFLVFPSTGLDKTVKGRFENGVERNFEPGMVLKFEVENTDNAITSV